MRPKVIDVLRQVLDDCGVVGSTRVDYRNFARQLIQLWLKGHTHIRMKVYSERKLQEIMQKLEELGIEYNIYEDYAKDRVVVWFVAKSEEELIYAYHIMKNLDMDVLQSIVEELRKYDELHII